MGLKISVEKLIKIWDWTRMMLWFILYKSIRKHKDCEWADGGNKVSCFFPAMCLEKLGGKNNKNHGYKTKINGKR